MYINIFPPLHSILLQLKDWYIRQFRTFLENLTKKMLDGRRWKCLVMKILCLLMNFFHLIWNQFTLIMENYLYIPHAPKTQRDQTECIIHPSKPTSSAYYSLPKALPFTSSFQLSWSSTVTVMAVLAPSFLSGPRVSLQARPKWERQCAEKHLRARTRASSPGFLSQFSHLTAVGALKNYYTNPSCASHFSSEMQIILVSTWKLWS